MVGIFGILVLLTLSSVVVAFVRPKAILWKMEAPTRKHAVSLTMIGFVMSVVIWGSLLNEADVAPPPLAPQISAPPTVVPSAVLVAKPEPLPAGMEERIISLSNAGLVAGLRNHAPRLAKITEEKRGPVVVETYVSEPSKVQLVLETLPGHGLLPANPAMLTAKMTRPLADKPSPHDGGLANTLDTFVSFAAPDWYGADQKAFVGECLMMLLSEGCDRTDKGVRVTAKRYGTDSFVVEAFRP